VEVGNIQFLSHMLGVSFEGLLETAQAKLRKKHKQGALFKPSKKDSKSHNVRQYKETRQRRNSGDKSRKTSSNSASPGRTSASPGPMSSADKAAAKGILRRRKR